MTPSIYAFVHDAQLLEQLRGALEPSHAVIPCPSLDAIRRQVGRGNGRAVLVHLDRDAQGATAPHSYLAELQSVAGNLPVWGFLDPRLSDAWMQSARQILEKCLVLPVRDGQIRDLVDSESGLADELAELCASMPYRALHGKTRSLLTFSPQMFDMIEELKVPAAHDVTVLLIGETGSGKTYLARLIHELSDRRDNRCLTVACGALPPDLIESELFGYVKGAFTGADRDKEGKFAAAGRGTLLLDEIDVLPPEQQAKLLRVIETGEYEPVGSNETQHSAARLIVASNYDLEGLVQAGTFRKDLYFRLNMLCFRLLPLRERPLDIEYLVRKFALEHSRAHGIRITHIDPEFLRILRGCSWPGNVRELENVIRRAVLYCRHGVLTAADLPGTLRSMSGSIAPLTGTPVLDRPISKKPVTLEERVEQIEQRIIEESLRRHNHHRTATARELGISRVTLYNKMKKFGMLK